MNDLIINPFDTSGYGLATMTSAVNLIPNNYGRVRQLGLFQPEGVRTRTVIVENINGVLTLLQSQSPGAPAPRKQHGKATTRSFIIPHIPYDDRIMPSDIQGRQAGTVEPKTLQVEMTKRLTEMRAAHAITEEHLMMGAVKGTIIDADGTILYNLHDEFGITAKTIDFALDVADTDVSAKCRETVRHIEDNLYGDVMMGVRCLCDETFFDALIGHAKVKEFYLNHAKAIELTGSGLDPRKGFSFGGITFEEYRGKATDPSTGSMRAFIAAARAHFFPVGTQTTFKVHHAPAEYMETVNTSGIPIYAKQVMAVHGKWVDVYTESNPLPLCRRPGCLVTGTI